MLEVKPPVSGPARVGFPQAGLSIAEAARRTRVSVHTLRYYERAGLVVTAVDRTVCGRRRYHKLDLDWVTICTRLRATGMPIRGHPPLRPARLRRARQRAGTATACPCWRPTAPR